MAIKWTPWNVPMHRRQEVIWASFAVFIALICGPLCTILICYLLVMYTIQFCGILFLLKNFKSQTHFKIEKTIIFNFYAISQWAGSIYWKLICIGYLTFIYFDRNAGEIGGRGAG